ncbi:MAG: nicotinate phosphoribosyltransferase [Clostridiales bacterium]|nr:nicotinate phosphoribosyltransferase [Clostridiales bacterium]
MRNLTLLTDLYQLTMMNAYLETDKADTMSCFDLFYRQRQHLDFAVCAGLEQVVEYINNLHFSPDDIAYLKSLNMFGQKFFDVIENFKFTGSIRAVREGEIIFPNVPILTVTAPLYQAQLIETAILNIINHQTLIATKSLKICQEAKASVMEFGLRRAQGPDAGIYGARAAIIGGCSSTSNVFAAKYFDAKPAGTHAHSWIMSFDSELEAFRAYAKIYPNNTMLLVDTYDTLRSGVPNAIKVFDEMKAQGLRPIGIRLDSGDLAYLSKKARKMMDDAGHTDCVICASGDIDEYILSSLNQQGARIDIYGIGTKLITSALTPALGGVYKMCALKENGKWMPKMKVSDTAEKITNPGIKTTYRIYDSDKMAFADLICLKDEVFDTTKPLTIFHPVDTWKTSTLTDYSMRDLMVDVFVDGKQVYTLPSLDEISKYAQASKSEFWEEYTRLLNPHVYKVDLSQKLYDLKTALTLEHSNKKTV